ncbi:MAG: DUF3343 domain-containing protein [Gemmatimonadetes bacterium]|nr:DUF3343 domain-containing protein [Gemmatimonadota bacterium]
MTAILVFDTTHHAMWAEQIALDLLLGVQVVPAPADSGAKCDLALEVLVEDEKQLCDALAANGVPYGIYGRSPAARPDAN